MINMMLDDNMLRVTTGVQLPFTVQSQTEHLLTSSDDSSDTSF
jgi:hypothetical protein